jgi:hypothetical protein
VIKLYLKPGAGPVLVAHTCNPSYLGGRDQDEPAQAIGLQDPILKKTITKKGW